LNDPIPNQPSQPNLEVSAAQSTWSFRFWLVTVLTGVTAGLIGGALMRLLHAVEHIAWRYDAGTLLEAIDHVSPARHVLILLAAGLLVGAGGILLHNVFGRAGEADSAIWFRSGRLPLLPTLVQAVHSIVTVAMGTSLGHESPIKQAGGAIALVRRRGMRPHTARWLQN